MGAACTHGPNTRRDKWCACSSNRCAPSKGPIRELSTNFEEETRAEPFSGNSSDTVRIPGEGQLIEVQSAFKQAQPLLPDSMTTVPSLMVIEDTPLTPALVLLIGGVGCLLLCVLAGIVVYLVGGAETTTSTTTTTTATVTTTTHTLSTSVTTTSTMTTTTLVAVSLAMTVKHLDYDKLVEQSQLCTSMEAQIRRVLAEEAELESGQIDLVLRKGSVVVEATIAGLTGAIGATIHSTLEQSATMRKRIEASIITLTGISDVSTGPIEVSALHASIVGIPAAGLGGGGPSVPALRWGIVACWMALVVGLVLLAFAALFFIRRRRLASAADGTYTPIGSRKVASASSQPSPGSPPGAIAKALAPAATPSPGQSRPATPAGRSTASDEPAPVTNVGPPSAPTPTQESRPSAEEEQLMGMGFSQEQSLEALRKHGGNIEQAATELLQGPSSADEPARPDAPTLPAAATAPMDPAEADKLDQLTGMGFTEEQARAALLDAGGDAEVALEKLLASAG